MLDQNSVDIVSEPISGYEEEFDADELEEVDEETFEASARNGKSKRTANYTDVEDIALVKAWEMVSIDVVTGNDQTDKKYRQRIENKFHQIISPKSNRTMRSLQGRYDVIKACCSRWSACLEQVRNAPPSGVNIDDYNRIAQERYKDMAASKKKPFTLFHCWKLLVYSEKWKLRDQEAPPSRKGSTISLDEDDDDEDDEPGAIKKDRPDETKKVKAELKRRVEQERLMEKIDDLMKSKQVLAAQQLQAKLQWSEKKHEDKRIRWLQIREDEKRKLEMEERKIRLEETKTRASIIAEENRVMMMDPTTMDHLKKEW